MSSGGSGDSVDEAEVERIFQERKLQKQAQEELEEQARTQALTAQDIQNVVD